MLGGKDGRFRRGRGIGDGDGGKLEKRIGWGKRRKVKEWVVRE